MYRDNMIFVTLHKVIFIFTCPKDNDDCTGVSCLNGGSCIDGLNSYTCKCASGFDGDHCEQGIQ